NSIITALIIVLLLFVAGLVLVILFVPDKKQKGVILQAVFRSNFAIIGIPLASNIFGEEGQTAAALISAFSVPMFNVLAVISLVIFIRDEKSSAKAQCMAIVKKIVTNPLILGTACGMLCLAIRPYCGQWRLSTGNLRFIYKAIDALAVIAPWLSLIILGGNFRFSAVKRLFPQISVTVAARLIIAPIVGMTLSYFLPGWLNLTPLSGADYAAMFALFASPVAIASVAMADQMGSDSELAGQILVWTTLLSAFTLFVWTALLRHIGLF
ncbi:MAG: AEC family transporter, partial [Treponemataceae bacterium]|nr:AEC family transporter [Treponemataceae bacterium]